MPSSFSGTYTSTVVLNSASQNPATITSTGKITVTSGASFGSALYGNNGANWIVTNLGTVIQSGVNSFGINLSPASTVINGSTSNTTALVSGTRQGVNIQNGTGTVTNYGTIQQAGTAGYSGIALIKGGTVRNFGLITSQGNTGAGVSLNTGSGTVNNTGTIAGTGTASNGVSLGTGGGSVVNGQSGSAAGLITGYQDGIFGGTAANEAVINFGAIRATETVTPSATAFSFGVLLNGPTQSVTNSGSITAAAGTNGVGVQLNAGGLLTNNAGGVVAASGEGFASFGGPATVVNSGSIGGTASGSGTGVNISFGSVTNNATGTISGGNIGISAGGTYVGTVTLQNAGLIVGTSGAGVNFHGTGLTGETVTNSGTIQSLATANNAVNLSVGRGTLANSGLITGVSAGVFVAGTANNITNTGTIAAAGTSGSAVNLGTASNATIVNTGTMTSTGTNASTVNISSGSSATITNGQSSSTAGVITGYHIGIFANTAGSSAIITNYGTIQSTQLGTAAGTGFVGEGLLLDSGATITNFGLIATLETIGGGTAINVQNAAGTLNNSGTVSNVANTNATNGSAVYFGAGGSVRNTGLISGGRSGITFNAAGTVNNFGTITNASNVLVSGSLHSTGVLLQHGGLLTNGTTGSTTALISSPGNGVYTGGISTVPNGSVGTVVNFGSILSTGTGSYGADAVQLASGGTVTNYGLLSSLSRNGVSIRTGAGTVRNFGTISEGAGGTGGDAVSLGQGGTVTNYGLITGSHLGVPGSYPGAVDTANVAATVRNFGTITNPDNANAINLLSGGTVINGSSTVTNAAIYGQRGGIYVGGTLGTPTSGAYGLVTNYGTISNGSTASQAIRMVSGGSIANHGLITSPRTGISFGNMAGTVNNFATVISTAPLSATSGTGIYLGAGGNIVNHAGAMVTAGRDAVQIGSTFTTNAVAYIGNQGLLSGNIGIGVQPVDTGNTTVVNSATITGTGGTAVTLGSGNNLVVVRPGAVFNGIVNGGTGGTNTLEFAGGSHATSGLGSKYVNFSMINVDAGAGVTLGGSNTIASGVTLNAQGSLGVASGTVLNNGLVSAAAGVTVGSGGTVTNYGTVSGAGGTALTLVGSADTLVIEPNSVLTGAVAGFGGGDVIDFAHVVGTTASFASGVLSLLNSGTPVASVNLAGSFTSSQFAVQSDGNGGSDVTIASQAAGPSLINNLGGAIGFGPNELPANDDGSSSAIDVTAVFGGGLNLFGTTYNQIYINTNGNITFSSPLAQYTPSSIGAGYTSPIIAPFWADVDTRGGATTPTGGNATGSNRIWYDLDRSDQTITITWDDVGYYNAETNKADAFQVQLTGRGNGNFAIKFIYQNISWVTGDASGGSNGLGGTPARAGYSAGDGIHYFELPESGNQAQLLQLPTTAGNTGQAGVWQFQVTNGTIGVTYTGQHLSGIVLSDPSTQIPAVVTAGSYITNQTAAYGGDAVYGTNAAAWNFTNFGTVKSTASASNGVFLKNGGNVTNGSGSSTGAVISSVGAGVQIQGRGTVVNYGTVTGQGGAAVVLGASGSVVVDEPGAVFNGAIANFVSGDTIDFAHQAGTGATFAGGVLTLFNGTTAVASIGLSGVPTGQQFQVASDGSGGTNVTQTAATPLPLREDLNNNGVSDLLMTNSVDGTFAFDEVSSGQMSYTPIGSLGQQWQLEGVGSFLGDGRQGSLAIRHGFLLPADSEAGPGGAPGTLFVGEVVNNAVQYAPIGGLGPEWEFEGAGRLLGGTTDNFLIYNGTSGGVVVGSVVNGTAQYTQVGGLGAEWQFEGTGAYLGDGKTGLLLHNGNNGSLFVGEIVNGAVQYTPVRGLGSEWQFEGSGDLLNHSRDDFLIRNANNGQLFIGEVTNGAVQYTGIGGLGQEWQILGLGNYDGASEAEFLMQNGTSGSLVIGAINGGTVTYNQVGGVGFEWNFHASNTATLT